MIDNEELQIILENTLTDLRKKEISPLLRAKLVKEYMDRYEKTLGQTSAIFGIPKTTLHTWLNYNKISEEKYDELVDSGLTKTEIFQIVKTPVVLKNVNKLNPYIHELRLMLIRVREMRLMIKDKQVEPELVELIKEVVNELNRALIKVR